jgi:hypothetical protein
MRIRSISRSMAATASVAVVAFTLSGGVAAADHTGPIGSNFGFADDVAGTAFPGNNAFWAGTCDLADHTVDNGGFGAPPDPSSQRDPHCIDHGVAEANPEVPSTWLDDPLGGPIEGAPSWRRDPVAQAGGHPDATVSFWLRKHPHPADQANGGAVPDGDPRDILVKLPRGFAGDPTAVPFCRSEDLRSMPTTCPPETQIGVSTVTLTTGLTPRTATFPVYNAEPRDGKTAEFMISGAGGTAPLANIPIVARVRTEGDFGVDTMAIQIPGGIPLLAQTITIWGVPWSPDHDVYRPEPGYGGSGTDQGGAGMPRTGLAGGVFVDANGFEISQEPQPYQPSWGDGKVKPFIWNPSRCGANSGDLLVTWIETMPWQIPANVVTEDAPADVAVDGCEDVPFGPSLGLSPTTTLADAPSGIEVDLALPPNPGLPFDPPDEPATQGDVDDYLDAATDYWRSAPGRLAPSALKDTTVTLPPGMAVNPSGAAGLQGCSDGEIGMTQAGSPPLFDNSDPFDGDAADGVECPAGSKIGTVEVSTPVLEDKLTGEIALGQPKSTDPTSGEMFRMFLVVRNRQRGVIAKVFGSAVADPSSGQLTATFANNPELPLERVRVTLKGGERGTLRTPQRCGAPNWASTFTAWSGLHGATAPVETSGAFAVSARCSFPFAPTVDAGTDNRVAGGTGAFSFTVGRQDGEQWIQSLSAKMPRGLLASLKGVPLCSNAQADAGTCPPGSRVGAVDAAAGAGNPYFLERKGDAYLTEGYRGAPYGLAVKVPVEAGPFRGAFALTPIVVRQALHVDRESAQVTVESDPLPHIWHGIPLAMRQATVRIDRPGFMRNPTDCSPMTIDTAFRSTEGTHAAAPEPFQASRCASLPFRPKLAIRLTGKKQVKTGRHPGVRAAVRQPGAAQAGIAKAVVRLPKSLALDPGNAQTLCEFEDGTRPDVENHCPKGSIVGRAKATTPLLNRPLTGNIYFVKNVRIDPDTGNAIRTLPMFIVALRGEIAVNLRGESSTTKAGRLVNTFANVPDAPISRFNFNLKGGKRGILTVTRTRRGKINLCAKPKSHIAATDMDGQNGRRHDFNVRLDTPCKKKRKGTRR